MSIPTDIWQMDADTCADAFGVEAVTYNSVDPVSGTVTQIQLPIGSVVIERFPPEAVREDGKTQSLDVAISIPTDLLPTVNPGKDSILMAIRLGGPISNRMVTMVDPKSDVGMWRLRVR